MVSVLGPLVVLLSIVHVITCLLLILVVLVQRGRSGDLASAFGGGPSQTNIAALSAEDVFTRVTKYAAFVFMATSILLGLLAQRRGPSALDIAPATDEATATPGDEAAPDAGAATSASPDGAAPGATPTMEAAPVESTPPTDATTEGASPDEMPPGAATEPAPGEATAPPATPPTP